MPRGQKKQRTPAPTAVARHNSSDSENSDVEDRSHSRTSTSSVEDDVKQNGHARTNSHKEYSSSFITRVSSIPLIHDSVSTLHSYAKDNKYGRYALDTAGSAVETVNKYTEGYQKSLQPHLQPHIAKVDQLASKSLDMIEGTFPIVTKPTSEIVTQVKKPYVYVEESSKNAYTQIQSTIDTRVTAPVKSVTSSIASTAASTRDQITSTATSTATNIATQVNSRATPLVDGLETIVNRILPADSEGEKTPAGQTNQATRVVDIGRSVSHRVTRRVSIAVAPVTQSAKELRAAAEKNTVVVKSKDQITALNTRVNDLLEALRVHSKELQENVQKAPREASTQVQLRVSELSSKVLAEIDSLSTYLKEHSPALPESIQVRIQPLMTFVNDRIVVVKSELSKKDISAIQKARNILHLTTEETLPILQSAAQEIKDSLVSYQVKAQEKIHDVNSSVNLAAASAYHSARVIIVGK
ncbi:hypothetical protein BGZ99_008378 [Dissophora globulifera]|uniref:Uncharacterized protein n=1 Tax=Dissophora globulifera TaxID=979702 RepID=A0A9P6R7H9_9FUNG|nr:hypothetical protein BGZ99_008378 [Dissophora globulifera]